MELLSIKYLKLAYRTSLPNFTARVAIYTFFVSLPFMVLGAISALFNEIKFGEKIYWTIFITITLISVVTLWSYLRAMVLLSKRKDVPVEDHRYLESLDSKFYGLSRELLNVETELFSDGHLETKTSTELVATSDKIYSLEHNITLPHMPESGSRIELTAEETEESKIKLKPVIIIQGNRRLFWKLNFLPCLPRGKSVKYSYAEKSPPDAFAMNLEELKRRNMDYEFCSIRMSYPTKHFKYKLIFPKDFDPDNYDYDVWLGEGRVQHMDEYRRIHEFWRVGRNDYDKMFIELSIKYPVHGLIYALRWSPSKN